MNIIMIQPSRINHDGLNLGRDVADGVLVVLEVVAGGW
jgi:hypothetical protein